MYDSQIQYTKIIVTSIYVRMYALTCIANGNNFADYKYAYSSYTVKVHN